MNQTCALAAGLLALAVPTASRAQSQLPHGWTRRTAAGGVVILSSADRRSIIEFQSITEPPGVSLLDLLRGTINRFAAAYPQVRTVNAPRETDIGTTRWADIIVTFNSGGIQYERVVRIGVKAGHAIQMNATAAQPEFSALMRIVNAGVDPMAGFASPVSIAAPQAWKVDTLTDGLSATAPDRRVGVRFRLVSSSGSTLTDLRRLLTAVRKREGLLSAVRLQVSRSRDGAEVNFNVTRAGAATRERITVIRRAGHTAVQQAFAPVDLPLPHFAPSVSRTSELYALARGSRWLTGTSQTYHLPSGWPVGRLPSGMVPASSQDIRQTTSGLEVP